VRKILVTGATGVVGSAMTPHFLNEEGAEAWLLIRARDEVDLKARVEKLFDYWADDVNGPAARARARPLRGDVSLPRLGLDEATWQNLAREVTHIVHCAASVKLDMSDEEAWRTCIAPVERILELAQAARRSGQFVKLEYVSTLGVAGRLPGLVPEQEDLGPREFHNTYESAKAKAEEIVWKAIRDGLPATVHRPSMVVGDSRTGKIIRPQVFYFLARFLSGEHTYGIIPAVWQCRIDLIPANYVAEAIVQSSRSPSPQTRPLHLCSGPEGSVPLREVVEAAREIQAAAGQKLRSLRPVPLGAFSAAWHLLKRLSGSASRERLAKLGPFLDYAIDQQSFANERTVEFLGPKGVELPSTPWALPRTVLKYHWDSRTSRR
jgi:thioester reductase-like protein